MEISPKTSDKWRIKFCLKSDTLVYLNFKDVLNFLICLFRLFHHQIIKDLGKFVTFVV
jgi:hypothetical protein